MRVPLGQTHHFQRPHRRVIRDKYAVVQAQIDAAATPEEIKVALSMT